MLIATDDRKARVQGKFRNPSTKRSEVVKPTSNTPPTISQSQGMKILSLDAPRTSAKSPTRHGEATHHRQHDRAPRFLVFMTSLVVSVPIAAQLLDSWPLGAMAGFDVAAMLFLLLCASAARDSRGGRHPRSMPSK